MTVSNVPAAPFAEPIPLEIQNEVSFAERSGRTVMTLTAFPHGASDRECETFAGMFASLGKGYGGTLDQLQEHLAMRR